MTDEELVEVAAKAMWESAGDTWQDPPRPPWGSVGGQGVVENSFRKRARAAIAAVGPKIREAERERAAKIADDLANTTHYEDEFRAARAIAAAIRDDKEEKANERN